MSREVVIEQSNVMVMTRDCNMLG